MHIVHLKILILVGWLSMIKEFTNWLSNKWNLIGIYALCSFLVGMILYGYLTILQLIIIYILISIMSLVVWIIGVSRGILLQTLIQRDLNNFLKKIRNSVKKDKDK